MRSPLMEARTWFSSISQLLVAQGRSTPFVSSHDVPRDVVLRPHCNVAGSTAPDGNATCRVWKSCASGTIAFAASYEASVSTTRDADGRWDPSGQRHPGATFWCSQAQRDWTGTPTSSYPAACSLHHLKTTNEFNTNTAVPCKSRCGWF